MATAALLVGVVVALVAITWFGVRWYRTDPWRDAAWLAGSTDVSPDEVGVYSRYLRRLRTHRWVGGVFGVVFAFVVGLSWGGSVAIGGGSTGPLADPLFCGVAGVLVGALSAESYRLRLPRAEVASASLAPRPALPGRAQIVAARCLGGLALAVGAVYLAMGSGPGRLAGAILGAAVIGICELTRAAVQRRRRGALSPRALVVDGHLRAFAARTVAWLQLSAAILTATWVAFGVLDSWPQVSKFQVAIDLGGVLAGIVCLGNASPRPPRWVPDRDQQSEEPGADRMGRTGTGSGA